MYYGILALHLLGATIWTGGHLVLTFVVLPGVMRARDVEALTRFESRFERIGIPALVLQIATGLWLAWMFSPDVGAWLRFGDPVSAAIGVKLAILAATALLAGNARFRIVPRLSAETLPLMAWHIRGATTLAVLFVLTGAWLRTGGF